MKKTILLFLVFLSTQVEANRFEFTETGARFVLEITPTSLSYQSERLKHVTEVAPCNRALVDGLNLELLRALKAGVVKEGGVPLKVDEHELKLDLSRAPANVYLGLDRKIQFLMLEEKKTCK
jgi:hypothetical protein